MRFQGLRARGTSAATGDFRCSEPPGFLLSPDALSRGRYSRFRAVTFLSAKKPFHPRPSSYSSEIRYLFALRVYTRHRDFVSQSPELKRDREAKIMQLSSSRLLTAAFAALLASGVAFAQTGAGQSGGQSQTQDPQQKPNINAPASQQPAPPPADAKAKKDPGSNTPVQSPDTVNPKNSKEDVDAIGNRGVGKGINFYSLEKEIGLGKQLAQEVERSSKLVDDPVVTEYVNRVGQNLVRNSDAKVPFTIKVIDSDEVNAFALPGGFFYVNSGLVLRAQEESE